MGEDVARAGSKVVSEYLDASGLTEPLEALGFNLVGYGCTTCIGNSGPLASEISRAVSDDDLAVVSVLSGNRNFEGRINPDVKMNYLASPPLCVAYAIAGTMDFDIYSEPLGRDDRGEEVHLRDIWPSAREVAETIESSVRSDMFRHSYATIFEGDERWRSLGEELLARVKIRDGGETREGGETRDGGGTREGEEARKGGDRAMGALACPWDERSTYVRLPPYFEGMPSEPEPLKDIEGARVLALLGDSVTTDHISPAGSIKRDGPAGEYLQAHGISPKDFNSYGSRRGNHEVMMRGTFANIRLRNLLLPGSEGGVTRYLADGSDEQMSIYDAAIRYAQAGIPLVVLGGSEYGSGSSRDWAAKGTSLLGVRAVIAQSFERIHRSNLIGMGVLPLQFPDGESAGSLGLCGEEVFSIIGLSGNSDGSGFYRSQADRWDAGSSGSEGSLGRELPVSAVAPGGGSGSSFARGCGSIRPARRSTSATAGSSSTCCAQCSCRHERRRARRTAGGSRPARDRRFRSCRAPVPARGPRRADTSRARSGMA